MFLPQNLKEYLNNPMGKGSTAITNIKLIKSDLDSRYEKLLKDNKNKFKTEVYRDGDEYFFHIIIPSESERNNDYDVVIQFYMGDTNLKYDNFLNRYYVRFFSNCPSFVFTYAYVYNQNDFLVNSLRHKYTDVVLEDNPVIRNPAEIINFEKSVYFAAKYIDSNRNFKNKMYLKSIEKQYDANKLNKQIRTSDKILLEIKKENKRLSEEKQKAADENKRKENRLLKNENKITGNKMAKSTSSVNKKTHRVTPVKKIKPKKSTVKK